jgi:hypothetical protein
LPHTRALLVYPFAAAFRVCANGSIVHRVLSVAPRLDLSTLVGRAALVPAMSVADRLLKAGAEPRPITTTDETDRRRRASGPLRPLSRAELASVVAKLSPRKPPQRRSSKRARAVDGGAAVVAAAEDAAGAARARSESAAERRATLLGQLGMSHPVLLVHPPAPFDRLNGSVATIVGPAPPRQTGAVVPVSPAASSSPGPCCPTTPGSAHVRVRLSDSGGGGRVFDVHAMHLELPEESRGRHKEGDPGATALTAHRSRRPFHAHYEALVEVVAAHVGCRPSLLHRAVMNIDRAVMSASTVAGVAAYGPLESSPVPLT